jgi:hypothetical protein
MRAFTVAETVIASAIMVLVMGSLAMLFFIMAKEQREVMTDGTLQEKAAVIEDRLSSLLRNMSVSESVLFTSPLSGSTGFYYRIIVAKGGAPDYPREEVYFNTNTHSLIYDPNRATSGNEETLFAPDADVTLRRLYFFPSLKTDGTTDSTILNVVMEVDDDGYAQRKNSSGVIKNTSISRYFSVKLRNP